MTRAMIVAALVGLAASPLLAGGRGSVSGQYVEARTAEVFTGGCIMNSEAETRGKQAVLAWKVDQGSFNGVSLDGLSVVAAVAGDRNLGIVEMGGGKATTKSAVYVDERANPAQRMALVAMAQRAVEGRGRHDRAGDAGADSASPTEGQEISVATGPVTLEVNKVMTHDPSCGAMQWYHPLSSVSDATLGVADQNAFAGTSLGTKWSDPDKRSAFFGRFSY